MGYRFDIELTKRIRKYENFKICYGRGIRWLLEDENGTSIYCDQCGNIANFVLYEIQGHRLLNVPICKRHATDLEKSGNYTINDGSLAVYKNGEWDTVISLLQMKKNGAMSINAN